MSVETIAISIGFSMLAAIFVSVLFKGGQAVQKSLQPKCELCDKPAEELMENPYEKFYTCHKCNHIWSEVK